MALPRSWFYLRALISVDEWLEQISWKFFHLPTSTPYILNFCNLYNSRSQWPRGLRRGSAAARLLRLWVRIPPGSWTSVVCCVLSGTGLCDELITRPEKSYRLWCVIVCDLETSWMRRPGPLGGRCAPPPKKQTNQHNLCKRMEKAELFMSVSTSEQKVLISIWEI
jgi:hypothetical protein